MRSAFPHSAHRANFSQETRRAAPTVSRTPSGRAGSGPALEALSNQSVRREISPLLPVVHVAVAVFDAAVVMAVGMHQIGGGQAFHVG